MRRLMVRSDWPVIRRRALEALAAFEIILFENIATAQLMVAKPYEAISVVISFFVVIFTIVLCYYF